MVNWGQFLELLLRWGHVFAVFVWQATPLFYNYVYLKVQNTLPPDIGKVVNPVVLHRSVRVTTWATNLAFALGMLLYVRVYLWTGNGFSGNGYLIDATGHLTSRSWWIHAGIFLGIVKWWIVVFKLHPTFMAVIPRMREGLPPTPEQGKKMMIWGVIGYLLIGPALFLMLGAHHYSSLDPVIGAVFIIGPVVLMMLVKASMGVKDLPDDGTSPAKPGAAPGA